MGIFTKNAIISDKAMKIFMHINVGCEKYITEWEDVYNIIKLANKGRDEVTVYSIKYIPASNRSGWYPHINTIISVGISEASNII